MIKNYIKTAWRAINRHRAYSIINVFGLTLGIASCLVIFLVVKYELGYDKFNKKAARTYRVTLNAIDFNPCVSMAVAPALRNDFPELEKVSQVWFHESGLITTPEHNRYDEKGIAFADQYFTGIFDYQWLAGNPGTALAEPNTLVLTETVAHKYFGKKDAIGQRLNLDNKYDLIVTGVIKDVPGNTHLPFNFLVSFETVRQEREKQGAMGAFYWITNGSFAYIVTPEKYPVDQLQKRIKPFIKKNWGAEIAKEANLLLQPLTDIHFDQRYLNNTISYTTSRETYWALSIVAVFIMLIACINFINLATAQAIRRAKEVGVRKVLGSSRSRLIGQFMAETALMVIGALVLAILATILLLPQVANWLDIKIGVKQLGTSSVIVLLMGLSAAIILLAGLYPAFILSAFRPVESLKSKMVMSFRGLTLRKGLVIVQFAISQIMIIGTLVVAYQMDFFQNRDLGFNKEAVISFGIPDRTKNDVLKQELLSNPGVKEVSLSSGAPVYGNSFTSFTAPDFGLVKDDVTELKFIDEVYTDMFQLKMLAGEKIRRTLTTENDTVYNAVVNETMIHKMGIQEPKNAIGKHLVVNGNWNVTITGVTQDFQSESKHKKIRPCVLIYRPDIFYMASVRIRTANMKKTMAGIDKIWTGLFTDNLFSYEFLDDHIAKWYRQEQKEYIAFKLFSGIAILIGCLGLYGLVAFAAAQRTKEVGIRKVLGASWADIVYLFSREFIVLIAVAFIIAAPVAYYFMHGWLENFAYKITMGAGIFFVAIVASFLIAGVTIAYQAIKAGLVNPVKSLRTE